ncbi:MAG: DUF3256 family protein [Prevotella sp.]|jgi:hypothetical protein|nr:DUF3256 family protein [Prevotella sp.]
MKKAILAMIFTVASIVSLSAQEIGSIFLTAPENIIFGLEAAQKDLLISNPDDTTGVTVDRETYGRIKRLAMSSDFISIQTSKAGTTQIKLLPLINDSKIVCVVKTVCGRDSICDSRIRFYTTKWLPIDQGDLFPEKNKDWFIKDDADRENQDFRNAYTALDMDPMKMILSPSDNSLTLVYNIKNYLSEDDYKKIQPYLIEKPKIFNWDKSSYK